MNVNDSVTPDIDPGGWTISGAPSGSTGGPIGEYHLIGPPGCGKTFALTRTWIPKAVERYGPGGVAICSLTRGASAEIAARQVVKLPRERVATLHSLARASLADMFGAPQIAQDRKSLELWREHVGGDSGYDLLKVSPIDRQFDGYVQTEKPKWDTGQLTGEQSMAIIESCRHKMLPESEWPDEVIPFWERWCSWKRKEQLFDFTDLIERAYEDGTKLPLVDGCRVEALFVDEAQDLSALEMALVRQWLEDVEVMVLAGDPNQSIYGFRGASSRAFHPEDFPADRTYVLGQSFRVPPLVQSYAEDWLKKASDRVPVEYEPREGEAEASEIATFGATSISNPVSVADLLEEELDLLDRVVDPKAGHAHRTVAVLATAAYMLRPLRKELLRRGIRFWNPFAPTRGEWNPVKKADHGYLAFFEGPRQTPEPRLWTWGEVACWSKLFRSTGMFRKKVKSHLIRETAARHPAKVVDAADCDRIFSDWPWFRTTILPMLQDPERETEALDWMDTRLTTLSAGGYTYASWAKRNGVMSLRLPARAVIGTIHSVKGATFGSVILAPDLSGGHAEGWSEQGEAHDQIVHLMYVGLTRSSRRVALLSPSRKRGRTVPSVDW